MSALPPKRWTAHPSQHLIVPEAEVARSPLRAEESKGHQPLKGGVRRAKQANEIGEFIRRRIKLKSRLNQRRLLLVIREWLSLRDLVQVAGTFPRCRAVV